MTNRARIMAVCIFVLSSGSALAQGSFPSRVDLSFNRFYDYPDMVDALKRLQRAYPRLVSLESIGKSTEGRDMWLVTINNPETGPDTDKPAIFIDANIHGNEVQGGETCLYTIWYLTKSYGKIERLTQLMDRCAFYIVPSSNPDGRAHWFNEPGTPHSSRTGKMPTDNDYDGLFDEDGYDDLDGDGEITYMWIEDPHGRWRRSQKDPRIFERVRSDEQGQYTILGSEGIDNDGDGRVNEDGPGGYDMNRNWPSDWQPGYIQRGAGEYPFYYPEVESIGMFLVDHPNVAAVQSYHNAGGMILRGPGAKYREGEYPRRDQFLYDELGKTGEKVLPYYNYWVIWKDLYTVHGGFVTWTYEGLGIFSFTNELWTTPQYFYEKEGDWKDDARYKFGDYLEFEQYFTPVKEYDHPQYGKVLVGGWHKYSSRVPPLFMLEELCHRNFAFTVYHADQMPQLAFGRVAAEPLGEETWQVTVEIKNERAIPTVSARAADKKIGARDFAMLEGNGANVVASGTVNEWYDKTMSLTKRNPARIWNDGGVWRNRPTFCRWIVEARDQVEVSYTSEKGGTIRRTIELVR